MLTARFFGALVPQGALRLDIDQPGLRYRGFRANGAHNLNRSWSLP